MQEPEQRKRLTFAERREARRIARQLWIDCRGNPETAKGLAEEYARDYGVSILVIIAVVGLILQFIDFWYSQGVTDPGAEPMIGEPGGDA